MKPQKLSPDSTLPVWARRWKTVLFAIWSLFLAGVVLLTANFPWGGWQPLRPEHTPGERTVTAAAYDPRRKELLLFGGETTYIGGRFVYADDTWVWDGRDWAERHPEVSPAGRRGHAVAYDEKHDVIVLFGGESQNGYTTSDTWIWDGQEWEQLWPMNSPPSRRSHLMFYDPQRETVVLSGGFTEGSDDNTIFYNDAWEWDGENWKTIPEATPTPYLNNAGVIYDQTGQRAIIFNYDGAFTWAKDHWSHLEAANQPSARNDSYMAIDPRSGKMLLFGGLLDGEAVSDTWVLDDNIWRRIYPLFPPSARYLHIMFYDQVRQSFVIYGGHNGSSQLGEMWELVIP